MATRVHLAGTRAKLTVQPFCFQGKTPFPFVLQGRNPQIIPEPPIQKEIPGANDRRGAPPPLASSAPQPIIRGPWPHPARDKPSPAGRQAQLPGPGSRRPSSHPPSQVARLPSARLEARLLDLLPQARHGGTRCALPLPPPPSMHTSPLKHGPAPSSAPALAPAPAPTLAPASCPPLPRGRVCEHARAVHYLVIGV